MLAFGTTLSGLIALAIILMGARYLLDPQPAAVGFAIPGDLGETSDGPAWLAVKAARDIAIGLLITTLLIDGAQRQLGYLMLTIALIPIADGAIVLRSGGPKAVAYGVHWATAVLMLIAAGLLIA